MYLVRCIDSGIILAKFKNVDLAEDFCDRKGWKHEGENICVTYKEG